MNSLHSESKFSFGNILGLGDKGDSSGYPGPPGLKGIKGEAGRTGQPSFS